MGKWGWRVGFGVVLALAFAGVSLGYSGWTGAREKRLPRHISTVEDWQDLMATPGSWDQHYILANDLDLEGVALSPIGNDSNHFAGFFDGNDHFIENVDINIPGGDYVGLFGYVGESGHIANLGLKDVTVNGGDYVGGMVGRNYGSVAGCYAIGSVSGTYSIGGLVGRNVGSGSVTDSYAVADVNVADNAGGGLVGKNRGSIVGCYSAGTVSGGELIEEIGGLAGRNSGDLRSCYSTADVTGCWSVGGLVGYNYNGSLTACYSAGSVAGCGYVGGLIGKSSRDMPVSCFWDLESSGRSSSHGGLGLTTAEMKSASTYRNAGWAGEGWVIEDGVDYPRLEWEGSGGAAIGDPEPPSFPGAGTEEDPYQIWTGEDFAFLGGHVSMMDKHIVLMQDIDLSETELCPIGGLSPFVGFFDGNDHVILNAEVNMPSNNFVGLFGYVGSKGEIFDLHVEDVSVRGRDIVGGLAGFNSGFVRDCGITGSVTGNNHLGGLIGRNESAVSGIRADVTIAGKSSVGGLIGRNYSGVHGCVSTGSVRVYGDYGGGLIGTNNGSVIDCHATGSVLGNITGMGGLVGDNDGSISRCFATGDCEGDQDVGGLVGINYGSVHSSYATGSAKGVYITGGLAGSSLRNGNIRYCFATGSVEGRYDFIGGLVGETNSIEIFRCYSTGSVSGNFHVGGLVGRPVSSSITNCYSTGSVSGDREIGGLVGSRRYGTVSGSFWDEDTSGLSNSAGGEGKSTGQMQDPDTFVSAGWDFVGESVNGVEDVWGICEGMNYPRLVWQIPAGDFVCPDGVGFEDFGELARYWRASDGGDVELDSENGIGFGDLEVLCGEWLLGRR